MDSPENKFVNSEEQSITIEKLNSMVKDSYGNKPTDHFQKSSSEVLFQGNFAFNEFAINMHVHVSDTIAVSDNLSRAMVKPAFTVMLLLEGEIDAAIGEMPLKFSAKNSACGHTWSQSEESEFTRVVKKGQRVRKVNISLPLKWLNKIFEIDKLNDKNNKLHTFLTSNLALYEWKPSTSSIRCAEDILKANQNNQSLNKLASCMWAMQIVYDALAHISQDKPDYIVNKLKDKDLSRIFKVRDLINSRINEELHLEQIASESYMSVTTLQRLFKQCFGKTVIEFVRSKKLELAKHALIYDGKSINHAAFIAGYSNAANFSTAFQREYGYPPSRCQNKNKSF